MLLERHLHERQRPALGWVEARRQIPLGHAHVVLLGREADLLVRLGHVEALITPRAGELTGEPGVRGLPDRHHVVAVGADEHPPIVPSGR